MKNWKMMKIIKKIVANINVQQKKKTLLTKN